MKSKILTLLGATLLLLTSGNAYARLVPEIDGALTSQVVTVVGGVLLLCHRRR